MISLCRLRRRQLSCSVELKAVWLTTSNLQGLEVTQKRTSPQGAGTGTVTYQASGVKTLGLNRRGARSAFVPPFRSSAATGGGGSGMCRQAATGDGCNDDSTRQW